LNKLILGFTHIIAANEKASMYKVERVNKIKLNLRSQDGELWRSARPKLYCHFGNWNIFRFWIRLHDSQLECGSALSGSTGTVNVRDFEVKYFEFYLPYIGINKA